MTKFDQRDLMPSVAERQRQRYREMSPGEKLAIADGLWDLAWDATKAGVRMRQPALSENGVADQARKLMHDASD
ncbi:MAG: hypothetical protein M3Y64_00995 [Gemmatimonadota bacterium]|nr:hypothetical protein [Gemmatimonadota bacterium]